MILKNLIKFSTCIFLLLLSSCSTHRIDEKYAAEVVKDELSISGNVSAQKLKGGLSNANLFLVTDDSKKYVIRFTQNESKNRRDLEIFYLKAAANGGYGPQVYFADSSQGIVIMEYLSGKKISYEDLQSDQSYVALAHLLKKIHHGQAFRNIGYNIFDRIDKVIQSNKFKCRSDIPLTEVEYILTMIRQALLPHLTTAPCHNDLVLGNLISEGDEFKAIDYVASGLNDPYFDLATVASQTGFYSNPDHEKILFATYLGRAPSETEEAKLYLMKQVVLIKWAFDALNRLTPENVHQYGQIEAPPLKDLTRELIDGNFDLSEPKNNVMFLKAHLNQVSEISNSQEFRNSLTLLADYKNKQNL